MLLLGLSTYGNSWGQVLHTENLLVLHALVVGFARSADAWSLDARRGPARDPHHRYGWPVRLMAIIVVLTYVVAGWAKYRNGGMEWITGDTLLHQVAHDNLRKAMLGDTYSPLAGLALSLPWTFPLMAAFTMVVEVGAPFALLGDRFRSMWVATAFAFHWGVLAVMAILFPYQLLGIAFVPFFRAERLGWTIIGRVRRSGTRMR